MDCYAVIILTGILFALMAILDEIQKIRKRSLRIK